MHNDKYYLYSTNILCIIIIYKRKKDEFVLGSIPSVPMHKNKIKIL